MFDVRVDVHKNRLYVTLAGAVSVDEGQRLIAALREQMPKLEPGFALVHDFSRFQKVPEIDWDPFRQMAKALRRWGVRHVVRVVGRAVESAVELARISKALGYDPHLAYSREEADALLESLEREAALTAAADEESGRAR